MLAGVLTCQLKLYWPYQYPNIVYIFYTLRKSFNITPLQTLKCVQRMGCDP